MKPVAITYFINTFLLTGQVSSKIGKVLLGKFYREVSGKTVKPALFKLKNAETLSPATDRSEGKF
ncbi:hypothetical protein E1X46_12830 [Listeria monocytogenes]|uniref:hypothetical protein n=1 Tax=Listeria monocytogenes TaxID=1639 RepID=UPI00073B61B0|nr:hypothetical protein [Listeria monocytogenes]EAE3172737.1 hypothetical protein [Listeria monocytogenes]KSZ48315.1 hypothetical protein AOA13_1040c [Listeria monocytogenes]